MKPHLVHGLLVLGLGCTTATAPARPAAPEPPDRQDDPVATTRHDHEVEVLGTHDGWAFGRRCDDHVCRPILRRTTGGVEHVLPVHPDEAPWAVDGIELQALSVADLDGDGRPEVRVDWKSIGTPRPALGSLIRTMVTIVDPGSGTVRLHTELGRLGGDSEELCEGTLTVDPTGADLVQHCQLRACKEGNATPAECAGGPEQHTQRLTLAASP